MSEWEEVKPDTGMWLPTVTGDHIEGEVVETREGMYGIQVTLEIAGGAKLTTPSHKALQNRLRDFKVGDSIKVVFMGTELPKVKGQQGVRLYQVFKKPAYQVEEVV